MLFRSLNGAGIEIHIEVYVTCDDTIVDSADMLKAPTACQCADGCRCCEGKNSPTSEKDSSQEGKKRGESDPRLPCAALQTGRPVFDNLFRDAVCHAEGEIAVTVCGPLGLSVSVRSSVVRISDELAVHKGSGLQGIYLHVENFQ